MAGRMKHLLCFGFGFSARTLAAQLDCSQWRITGTSRTDKGVAVIQSQGCDAIHYDQLTHLPETVTHIVASAPPDDTGDPILFKFGPQLAERTKSLDWVAYLSTTGVYGDHAGGWVDETTPLTPTTDRGHKRLAAETSWLGIEGLPLHIFRLAGIYGPDRNQLASVRDGSARRIIKPGQVFSRIHVDDIAGILRASMAQPNPGRAYNCADDEPCPPQEVVACAAELLGVPPPPEVSFDRAELSPMAKSFYAESKRVSNARVKQELGYAFKYKNYRDGLRALLNQ
jgi:nucleoside-diphosphate-sugar epimerase